jgi:hypothetical protein
MVDRREWDRAQRYGFFLRDVWGSEIERSLKDSKGLK